MARKLESEWRDEKAMSESLMERIKEVEERMRVLEGEKQDLAEQNRDLGFFISGMEKLKSSGMNEEELREGTVSLPEVDRGEGSKDASGKGKGKGKGRKKGTGKGGGNVM